jgi:hypothetical protein
MFTAVRIAILVGFIFYLSPVRPPGVELVGRDAMLDWTLGKLVATRAAGATVNAGLFRQTLGPGETRAILDQVLASECATGFADPQGMKQRLAVCGPAAAVSH